MEDQSKFELVSELANRISANSKSVEESKEIMKLIREVLLTRWGIGATQTVEL